MPTLNPEDGLRASIDDTSRLNLFQHKQTSFSPQPMRKNDYYNFNRVKSTVFHNQVYNSNHEYGSIPKPNRRPQRFEDIDAIAEAENINHLNQISSPLPRQYEKQYRLP